MFKPQFSINQEILKNIASIEYSRAIIESTVVLPVWENRLKNEAKTDFIYASLQIQNINTEMESIKRAVNQIGAIDNDTTQNIINAYDVALELAKNKELSETELKEIYKQIIPRKKVTYRSKFIKNKSKPEELLAEIVATFDWASRLEAREMHPVIFTGILRAKLESLYSFEELNSALADLCMMLSFKISNYSFKDYVSYNSYFLKTKNQFAGFFSDVQFLERDYTNWLEYFTSGLASETAIIQEKVKLLSKDTKVAKAASRVGLTSRQERIIEFIQDYGQLVNKDFGKLFPDKSEDSILRDLKALIDKKIIIKSGSTKSSRYELK